MFDKNKLRSCKMRNVGELLYLADLKISQFGKDLIWN